MSNQVIKKFNARANKWLTDYQQYTEAELRISPEENGWNMALLYDHVMKVAYHYQIPHFKLSQTKNRNIYKNKKLYSYLIFDLNIIPPVTISMESFPEDLTQKFTPEIKDKERLLKEFEEFISHVHSLIDELNTTTKNDKTYHPFFGTITAREWFALIEIHMRHHEKQRKRIDRAISHHKILQKSI